jgi:hypothetical protein
MSFFDRLADRMMAALPDSPVGAVLVTFGAAALLVGAGIYWLGWLPTAAIVIAAACAVAGYVIRQAMLWRLW